MRKYNVVGIMSGTSMDGVDLACCELVEENGNWSYEIKVAETIPYDAKWRVRLSQLRKQTAAIYVKTHTFYGHYLGQLCNEFIARHQLKVDLISSHGHTVFHQPNAGYTAQVGDGSAIHAITGLPVVNDFRTVDVALEGQGAPLVPVGDRLLFGEYDYALNLGGFANISVQHEGKRVAFDIAPCNIAFNRIARNLGQDFDKDGEIAQRGAINYELLKQLDELSYYNTTGPKSLGREWINSTFWPVVRSFDFSKVPQENLMKTLSDHVAGQIADAVDAFAGADVASKKVLVTGGGAYNSTLIELIQTHCDAQLVVPQQPYLVEYKEALIFALLGVLRIRNVNNCETPATGAKRDNIGGALWGDFSNLI